MTMIEALGRVDSLLRNTCTQAEKIAWLSQLDGKVKAQLLDPAGEETGFCGYDARTPLDQTLLIPDLWQELYLHWLEAQICCHNGEMGRYNEAITLFNTGWKGFVGWRCRTHPPRSRRIRYF